MIAFSRMIVTRLRYIKSESESENMDDKRLNHYKHLLDQHKESHKEVIDDMEEPALGEYENNFPTELSYYDNHPADLGSELFEMEHQMGLLKQQVKEVEDIETAKEKIEEGNYGKCEFCGKDIDPRRLELLPQARLCIGCARKDEEEKVRIKETTMNRRPSEEQVLDAYQMNDDGVRNQALEDVMHYGSSSDLE